MVFGVGPSPYLLNATIMHHFEWCEDKYSVTVSKLKESMYVDDVVMGTDTLREAISTCIEARDIFAKGGFNLRKFFSNSRKLQNIFDTYFGTENLRVNLEELEAFVSSVDDCLELETQMPLSTEMYEQKALGMVVECFFR